MKTQELAMILCELEGKKKQVNIAQMSEIAALLPKLSQKVSISELVEYLLKDTPCKVYSTYAKGKLCRIIVNFESV